MCGSAIGESCVIYSAIIALHLIQFQLYRYWLIDLTGACHHDRNEWMNRCDRRQIVSNEKKSESRLCVGILPWLRLSTSLASTWNQSPIETTFACIIIDNVYLARHIRWCRLIHRDRKWHRHFIISFMADLFIFNCCLTLIAHNTARINWNNELKINTILSANTNESHKRPHSKPSQICRQIRLEHVSVYENFIVIALPVFSVNIVRLFRHRLIVDVNSTERIIKVPTKTYTNWPAIAPKIRVSAFACR